MVSHQHHYPNNASCLALAIFRAGVQPDLTEYPVIGDHCDLAQNKPANIQVSSQLRELER